MSLGIKALQKINRVTEKGRQAFGKADKTTDEIFDDNVKNFTKQQKCTERLLKEFKTYAVCMKAAQTASKNYYEALKEVYEAEWPASEHIGAETTNMELLWDDLVSKLNDQAMPPLQGYCTKFPELKAKIEKRNRKLLDFDAARHTLESYEKEKKKDDVKLAKYTEALQNAQRLYDVINIELAHELPSHYHDRIATFATHFQTVFQLDETFHGEMRKIDVELAKMMDDLGVNADRLRSPSLTLSNGPAVRTDGVAGGSGSKRGSTSNVSVKSATPAPAAEATPPPATKAVHEPKEMNGGGSKQPEASKKEEKPTTLYPIVPPINGTSAEHHNGDDRRSLNPFDSDPESPSSPTEKKAAAPLPPPSPAAAPKHEAPAAEPPAAAAPAAAETTPQSVRGAGVAREKKEPDADKKEEVQPEKTDEQKKEDDKRADEIKAKHAVLYRVRATHRYTAEDTDELSFDAGEFISVIPFEDPEDQDEGWLCGIKESNGEKGVFPANFTKAV